MDFTGKVGLVTGAASGIGRATVLGFAQRGGAVGVADINEANTNKVVAEITAAGGKAVAIIADVTKQTDIDMMIARTTDEFGTLDFLHNNAFGLANPRRSNAVAALTADLADDIWDNMIALGLSAVFRAIKKAIPVMRQNGGGAIVNTASVSGLRADYGLAAYNAAKAGLINLTRVVAIEYARHGIRANCICPGTIATPLNAPVLARPGVAAKFEEAIPMGRLGKPEEMANVILFLASDLASFVTGASFVADGGQTAKTGSPSFMPE